MYTTFSCFEFVSLLNITHTDTLSMRLAEKTLDLYLGVRDGGREGVRGRVIGRGRGRVRVSDIKREREKLREKLSEIELVFAWNGVSFFFPIAFTRNLSPS